MKSKISFFVTDEDEKSIEILKRLIHKIYPTSFVYTSADGLYTWEFIKKHNQPMIVICDLNVQGINGMQVAKKIREDETANKEVYFVLMIENATKEQNLKAFQYGANDFINKPFSVDLVVGTIRNAYRVTELTANNKSKNEKIASLAQELNSDAKRMKDLILRFQDIRIPDSKKICRRIKEKSTWIGEQLKKYEQVNIQALEHASDLAYAGKIFLKDNYINTPILKDGQLNNEEFAKLPDFTEEIIKNIRGFDETAKILRHIYENMDGSGFPDNLLSTQIPVGARVLRVLTEFEEVANKSEKHPSKIIEDLLRETPRLYDFRVLAFLDQYHAHQNINQSAYKEVPTAIKDLEAGMVVSRNIISNSGLKVLSAGTVLNQEKVDRILEISKTEAIVGEIYTKD